MAGRVGMTKLHRDTVSLSPDLGDHTFLNHLAYQIHAQANGPSAWGKLTEAGQQYYITRLEEAIMLARAGYRRTMENRRG